MGRISRPTGSDSEAKFMQWVWDILNKKFCSSSTVQVDETPSGWFWKVRAGSSSAPQSPVQQAFLPALTNIYDDYYELQFTDGSGVKAVARPGKLMLSIPFETIDGDLIAYGKTGAQTRNAAFPDTTVEQQVIGPRILVNDLFTCVSMPGGVIKWSGTENVPVLDFNGQPVVWQDLNVDGRAWEQVYQP